MNYQRNLSTRLLSIKEDKYCVENFLILCRKKKDLQINMKKENIHTKMQSARYNCLKKKKKPHN